MINYPVGINFPKNYSTIKRMAQAIKRRKYKNIVLICSGSSGAIIASVISASFKKKLPIIYIHKKEEASHFQSGMINLLSDSNNTFIVVDDFVVSGATLNHIKNALNDYGLKTVTAVCLYGSLKHRNYSKDFYQSVICIKK